MYYIIKSYSPCLILSSIQQRNNEDTQTQLCINLLYLMINFIILIPFIFITGIYSMKIKYLVIILSLIKFKEFTLFYFNK